MTLDNKTRRALEKKNAVLAAKAGGEFVRNCSLYLSADKVTQERINKIISWYTQGRQLAEMIRVFNGQASSNENRVKKLPSLSIIDLYGILYKALSLKQIKQRRKHLEFEFDLVEFYSFFQSWRRGYTESELVNIKTLKASRIARLRCLAAIKLRFYTSDRHIKELDSSRLLSIMRSAEATLVNGRPAYVIYMDKFPLEIIEEFNLPRLHEDAPEFTHANPNLHLPVPITNLGSTHNVPSYTQQSAEEEVVVVDGLDDLVWGNDSEEDGHTKENEEELLVELEVVEIPSVAPFIPALTEEEKEEGFQNLFDD